MDKLHTPRMRALFLDLDGVLHATAGPPGTMREFVWLPILLDLISGQADIGVVVHASARQHTSSDFLMQRLGLAPPLWRGTTDATLPRWALIEHWVATHETTSFRILDDAASEFPMPVPFELILCDPRKGVSDPAVQDQIRNWVL